MTQHLKSFRKDWERWSPAERAFAVVMAVTALVLLTAPVTAGLM